jgi:hypothetical protein
MRLNKDSSDFDCGGQIDFSECSVLVMFILKPLFFVVRKCQPIVRRSLRIRLTEKLRAGLTVQAVPSLLRAIEGLRYTRG